MHDVIKFQWVRSGISMEQLFSFTCPSKLGPSVGGANSVAHLSDRKMKRGGGENLVGGGKKSCPLCGTNPGLENKCARRKETSPTSKKKPLPKRKGTRVSCCWNVWDVFWWGEPLMQRTRRITRRTNGKYENGGNHKKSQKSWGPSGRLGPDFY